MNKELYKEILNYFDKDLSLIQDEIKSLLLSDTNLNHNDLEDFGLLQNTAITAQGTHNPLGLNPDFQKEVLDFLFAPSKRLRPVTLFLIKDMLNFKDTEGKITKLAAALELLHSATLVHDDIIDNAQKRRGGETFNFKYNSKLAVILGDYLLSLSLKLLSKIGSASIFSYFSENVLNICKGEINQFFNRGNTIEIEEYIEKSKGKTSSLFIAGAKSILYLINEKNPVPNNVQRAILEFILKFSLGFQIYDDIENFEAEYNNALNEKLSSDIKNGMYTLPYLYISQQNHLYDMMKPDRESKIYTKALESSICYLNNILDEAQNSVKTLENVYNINLLIKLGEVFKK